MKKFLLVASLATSVALLAAPAFADGPADHGGSDHETQGSSGAGQDNGNDPAHYDHDGNGKDRENRRTEIGGGPATGK